MTPLQLQMMLHYYTTPRPYAEHEPEHATSPAVYEQRNQLVRDDLLVAKVPGWVGEFKTTPRGDAYVKALCAMPLPISKWVMP